MASLHYMTVQDTLWINLQVTRKVHHYNYARLEEATFYQYAYGDSKSLFQQAARYLSGFLKMRPFDGGNAATAFVGCAAFLSVNGYDWAVAPENAAAWMQNLPSDRETVIAKVTAAARATDAGHSGGRPDIQAHVKRLLEKYSDAVHALVESDAEARSA